MSARSDKTSAANFDIFPSNQASFSLFMNYGNLWLFGIDIYQYILYFQVF